MIPNWRYLRVRWEDLSIGDVVSTISTYRGQEYTCGLYTVVSVEDRTLRNFKHRSFKLTEPNILKDELLVFRKINPHLGNQYAKELLSLLHEPVKVEAKKQIKPFERLR